MDEVQNHREPDATAQQADAGYESRVDLQAPAYVALVTEPIVSAGFAVSGLQFAE